MDDAAAVRVDERARDVLENAHRFAHGERAARQPRAQRLALDERHDEERQPHAAGPAVAGRGFAGAQHRHDVRMLQRGREHDLALEPVDRDGGRELERQHLDDDRATERVVARDEHGRHAAAPELSLEGVAGAQGSLEFVSKNGHVTVS